jgi:hypothetical protein
MSLFLHQVPAAPLGGALAALAGAAGALAYRRLTGTWPLVAELDEWALVRAPWEAHVAYYRANPRTSPLVVCLTTIPSRLDQLRLPLASLLRQSLRPAEIRLHLPEYSRREDRPYEVPAWLTDSGCFTVVRCEDHGPATKLIPALDLAPTQPALILDDDRLYGPRLVEDMDAAWRTQREAILCGSGWSAPGDLVDRPTTLGAVLRGEPYVPVLGANVDVPTRVDILQGLQSYLVQPRFFDREQLVDYERAPPEARWCDDVWISGHARVPRLVVPLTRSSTAPWTAWRHNKDTSLARNFNSKADPEARSNTVLLRYFRELRRW